MSLFTAGQVLKVLVTASFNYKCVNVSPIPKQPDTGGSLSTVEGLFSETVQGRRRSLLQDYCKLIAQLCHGSEFKSTN